MADPVTMFIVYAAISAAAFYLLKPKAGTSNPLDDSRTEPSVRGTLSTFLLGRIRVGPVIGYVGGRTTTGEAVEGGGGKGGSPKSTTTIFNEVGMHIISIGRGKSIKGIYQAGKLITTGEITRGAATYTEVDLGKEGSFTVYWGLDTQPVDTTLQNLTGLASTFPHMFYIVWNTKRLGTSPIWPQLEYDVEVEHPEDYTGPGAYLEGAAGDFSFTGTVKDPSTLDTTGYTTIYGVTDTTPYILKTAYSLDDSVGFGAELSISALSYKGDVVNILYSVADDEYIIYLNSDLGSSHYGSSYTTTYTGTEYSGVNPASALYQMLFSTYPHGLGLSTSDWNTADFSSLATYFNSTEKSPCTVLLRSGKAFKDGIGVVLQDFGLQLYYDTGTGKWRIDKVRTGTTPTVITQDEYLKEDTASALAYSVLGASRTVYSFKDSARKFSDSTIIITDDGKGQYSGDPNTNKVALNTITDLVTASMVASRREQESEIDSTLSVKAIPTLGINPSDTLSFEGLTGSYRVLEVEQTPDDAYATVTMATDIYAIDNNYEEQIGSGRNPLSKMQAVEDIEVALVETNRIINKDQNGCYAFRIRYGLYIVGSDIFGSSEDTTYDYLDSLYATPGGTLDTELPDTASGIVDGYTITLSGPDATRIEDLSTADELWRSGYQLAVIGTEVCYLQSIDVGTGELQGLIRGRLGTKVQTHAAGTPVFIIRQKDMKILTASYMQAGSTVYIKSLPYSSATQLSADDTTAESITYEGGGYRPLACENLTTDVGVAAWVAGTDIDFRWSYKNASDTGAAGIGLSGEASPVAPPEGTFKLVFLSGTTVKRTEELTDNSYTYTNANLVSDFGAEPSSFNVQVYEVLNGLTSEVEQITMTKI